MLTALQRMYKQQECVGTKPRLKQRGGRQFAGRRDAECRRLLKAGKLSENTEKTQKLRCLPIFICHLFEVEKTITYQICGGHLILITLEQTPPHAPPSPTPFRNPFPSQTHTKKHHVTRSLASALPTTV